MGEARGDKGTGMSGRAYGARRRALEPDILLKNSEAAFFKINYCLEFADAITSNASESRIALY